MSLCGRLFASLLLLLPVAASAQNNRLLDTRAGAYEPIQRLQQRGYLLTLNPTALPYTTGPVRDAFQRIDISALRPLKAQWYRQLSEALGAQGPAIDSVRVGGDLTVGARRSSSKRLNVLEPLGHGEPILPRAQLTGYLEWGPWIGQAGVTSDRVYNIDSDSYDVANRLSGRSEEVYFGYNGNRVDVFLGRFNNHWSRHGQIGAFLTDNPRSFDQIQVRLGSFTLPFHSILGRLDNLGPDSTYTGRSYRKNATRRYVFFHRLDWSPTPTLKLSLMEGEIYHSPTASISLRNLIPLHTLLVESANRPRIADRNVMIGRSIWTQSGPLTFYAQAMLDDILLARREERKRCGEFYPAVYTATGSAT